MRLLAIDGNSVLNRAFYGVRPLTTKDGIHTNAVFGFLNILFKLERELEPNAVAIAFDVGRKTFRNDQYEQYKATRKGMPEELAMQLPFIKEILTLMGYTILGCEGYEGDDILGTLSSACIADAEVEDTCIVATGDRDCLQLINDNVKVCLLKNSGNVIYDSETVLQDYSVTPKQIIDLKALMGDSSDNIPGVKGIGEKTAINLIVNHHSIDEIYQDIEAVTATPRVKSLLENGKDDAYMSYKLATICVTVPIDTSYETYIKKEPQIDELSKLMTRLEMFSFFEKMKLTKSDSTSNEANQKAKVTLSYKTCNDDVMAKLKPNDSVYIMLTDDILYVNIEDVIYQLCDNSVNDTLRFICDNSMKMFTFKAKPLIKKIKSLGYEDVNLEFDLEVAAYLLNPDSKGYDIPTLINRHLTDITFDEAEQDTTIRSLPYLCNELLSLLETEGMLKLYQDIELPLCEVLSDMEVEGIAVDKAGVMEFGDMLTQNIDIIKQMIFTLAGEEFNINSTKELAVILFEKLGLPAKKKTKTGYSTNADVLEELYSKHEIIPAILEYRQLAKLQSTYVVGLAKEILEDGRIHTTYNQTETRTGRISSIEPNLQNIPVRTKLGSEMRRFFVAREGYTLVDADYSQIELRILAHIADDQNMINAFLNGDDIHSITASQVFNCPLEEMTPAIRSRAKAINFGIVYGISAFSLSKDISVSVAEAKEYIAAYMLTYSGVADYMKAIVEKAREDEFVTTLYGRKRPLPDINHSNKLIKAFAERVALNAPIQGTAADIIKLAMVKVHRRIKKEQLDARLILQVHDELIIEAPAMQADTVKQMLKEEMQNAAKLSVPMLVDVHTGGNWYIAKG